MQKYREAGNDDDPLHRSQVASSPVGAQWSPINVYRFVKTVKVLIFFFFSLSHASGRRRAHVSTKERGCRTKAFARTETRCCRCELLVCKNEKWRRGEPRHTICSHRTGGITFDERVHARGWAWMPYLTHPKKKIQTHLKSPKCPMKEQLYLWVLIPRLICFSQTRHRA